MVNRYLYFIIIGQTYNLIKRTENNKLRNNRLII